MSYYCLKGEEISIALLKEMIQLDQRIFPLEEGDALPPEYFLQLYQNHKDGLFIVVDEEIKTVIGYLCCIVIDEKQRTIYLNGGHYRDLIHIGMKDTGNILYIHTIAIHPKFRGSGVMKLLAHAFVEWIMNWQLNGSLLTEVYAEAVTRDGVRTLTNGFGMVPVFPNQLDEFGCGYYQSLDCLHSYCCKVRKKDK